MSDNTKAWINRIGLVVTIVGIVGLSVAGGDASGAVDTGYMIAGIVGGLILVIKEIIASFQK